MKAPLERKSPGKRHECAYGMQGKECAKRSKPATPSRKMPVSQNVKAEVAYGVAKA